MSDAFISLDSFDIQVSQVCYLQVMDLTSHAIGYQIVVLFLQIPIMQYMTWPSTSFQYLMEFLLQLKLCVDVHAIQTLSLPSAYSR